MRSLLVLSVLICAIVLAASASAGQTRWVSDQYPLDMRSGNSNLYRVIKMLPPGTKVEVVRIDREAEFTEVVTGDGTRGWLANRYLMEQPASRALLEDAQRQLHRLEAEIAPLKTKVQSLEQLNASLQQKLDATTGDRQLAESELNRIREVSGNAVSLDRDNQALMEANQMLQHDLDVLRAENNRLTDRSSREWFVNGALVMGFGAMLAIFIPRLVPQRKSREWR